MAPEPDSTHHVAAPRAARLPRPLTALVAYGTLALATLSLSGCWSLMIHADGERCVYPGTRYGWNFATARGPSGWPLLVDVPFSFVLDTVLLPYDLTAFLPEDKGGDPAPCDLRGDLKVM
ncbi:YceK/YidQ family lipoprotein [Pseudomonas monteilii]